MKKCVKKAKKEELQELYQEAISDFRRFFEERKKELKKKNGKKKKEK